MKQQALLSLLLLLIFPIIGNANNDPCGCNIAVAIDGVYNYRYKRNDSESQKYYSTFFRKLSYEEFQSMSSKSTSASFSDLARDFGFDKGMSKEQYQIRQNELESHSEYQSMDIGSNEFFEKFGDKNVLDAWVECKKLCNEEGLIIWISESNSNDHILNIKFIPGAGMTVPVIKKAFIRNGKAERDSIIQGELIERNKKLGFQENEFSFTRIKEDESVKIDLQFESPWGDRAIILPKKIPVIEIECNEKVAKRSYRFNVNDPSENDGIDIPVDGSYRGWFPNDTDDKFGNRVKKVTFLQGFPHEEQYVVREVVPHPDIKNQILFRVQLIKTDRNNLKKGTFNVEVQVVYEECKIKNK